MAAAVERDYGAADYWERRYYAEPPPLDLYLGYEDRASAAPPLFPGRRAPPPPPPRPAVIPYLEPVLAGDAKDVLVSGCGASEIGAELSDRHAHRVVCVDARVSGVRRAAAARPRTPRF